MKHVILFFFMLATLAHAKVARTVHMTDKKMEPIYVPVGKTTILNFPAKPTKVIVGNQGLFAVEYIEMDLAISPLKVGAHSNLFVYLDGRRFGFELRATSEVGDAIVLVRDAEERRLKVKVRNE